MEKWAKSQNKKSKSSVVAPPPAVSAAPVDITPSSASIKQAAADMAYDVLMGKKLSNPGPLHVNVSLTVEYLNPSIWRCGLFFYKKLHIAI